MSNTLKEFRWSSTENAEHSLGHFGTNVNENLWSQIRHKGTRKFQFQNTNNKGRYLTLLLLFQTYLRAISELVKRNSFDRHYYYPQSQISKCYNNQTSLRFSMADDIILDTPKKSELKTTIENLPGTYMINSNYTEE